jgi:hypothetical protein
VVRFSLRTLIRSRQHRLIFAAYAGIGFAIALAYASNLLYGKRTWPLNQVNTPMLAASVVLLCFTVVGVRVVFAMPLALRANWIFRVTTLRPTAVYLVTTRRSLLVLAVAPVWTVSAVLFLSIWPLLQAIGHLLALALLGFITVDLSLHGFRKLPFTCSYLPGPAGIHVTSGAFAIALLALADLGVQIEIRALRDAFGYVKFISILALIAIRAMRRTATLNRLPDAALRFEEEPPSEIHALDLHRDGAMLR